MRITSTSGGRQGIRLACGAALAVLLLAMLLPGGIAEARPGDRLRARMAERMTNRMDRAGPEAAPAQLLTYGTDPAEVLDFWTAKNAPAPAPLVVFVHGGGWTQGSKDNATGRWKPVHYPAAGYHFASINYRLVPAATVEQQAQDVALALKALIARADALGIDRHRIVLMGHSAGAHLVALVGTDERYLRDAGLGFADVAGIIPIDGAAYDITSQMAQAGAFMQRRYDQAFGSDPARQHALSPTAHAAAPNAPAFLLLHVQRADGVQQTQALAAALRGAGTLVEIGSFPGEGLQGHAEINRSLGDPDYPATAQVDRWLKARFGQ